MQPEDTVPGETGPGDTDRHVPQVDNTFDMAGFDMLYPTRQLLIRDPFGETDGTRRRQDEGQCRAAPVDFPVSATVDAGYPVSRQRRCAAAVCHGSDGNEHGGD